MKYYVFAAITGLVVCSLGHPVTVYSQEKDSQDEASETSIINSRLDDLKAELSDAISELRKEYRVASDGDERKEIIARRRELELQIANQVVELTQQNDDQKKNLAILTWLVTTTKAEGRKTVLQLLLDDYVDSRKLSNTVNRLGQAGGPEPEIAQFFQALSERSPHDSVRGFATLNLAMTIAKLGVLSDGARMRYEESHGATFAEFANKWSGDKGDAEVTRLFKKCVELYSETPGRGSTIGELAERELFKMRLVIGKVAPDIEGEDLDGVAFKLSDYRGKVVMLDFWGDW